MIKIFANLSTSMNIHISMTMVGRIISTPISVCHQIQIDPIPGGILIRLNELGDLFHFHKSLFTEDEDGEMQVRDQAHGIKHWAYPQAGLKTLGHFKANSLMSNLHPILADINQQVSLVPTPGLNSDDEFEDDIDSHMFSQDLTPAIIGASSQGYNALMHRTHYRVKNHKVQLGVIMNALAGAYTTSSKTTRTAKHFIHNCHYTLPHDVQCEDRQ
jgi:hypothetical protein